VLVAEVCRVSAAGESSAPPLSDTVALRTVVAPVYDIDPLIWKLPVLSVMDPDPAIGPPSTRVFVAAPFCSVSCPAETVIARFIVRVAVGNGKLCRLVFAVTSIGFAALPRWLSRAICTVPPPK
jgi:hypothetical protein